MKTQTTETTEFPTVEQRAVPQHVIDSLDRARMADDGNPHELEHTAKPEPTPRPSPLDRLRDLSPEQQELVESALARAAGTMVAKKLSVEAARDLLSREIEAILTPGRDAEPDIDEDELEELITVDVLENDEDGNPDYVTKTIPRREWLNIIEPRGKTTDPFALGDAYYRGDEARFDYYWADTRPTEYRNARDAGWVPVRKSLDGFHDDNDQVVRMGESVLCRRPKSMSEKYAAEQRARAVGMVGSAGDTVREGDLSATSYTNEYTIDEAETSGKPRVSAADQRAEALDRAKIAKTGKRSFTFERNPIHENKVKNAVAALRGR